MGSHCTLTDPSLPLRKKKGKEEEKEEEAGHVFGWLSGEIRDRKHLGGRGGGGGEAALFVRVLYSMEPLRVSLVYGVTRTKQTRNLPSQRDAISPIPSPVPTKDKSVYEPTSSSAHFVLFSPSRRRRLLRSEWILVKSPVRLL